MMKNKNLRALIASASALWLSGALAQFERPPAELELIQLNDELFVIHNPGSPGNAAALITDEGVLLIDDKFEVDYDNIVAMIRTVIDQPVRYVVNTHLHPDHTGSNARFQEAGAVIVASEMARVGMVERSYGGLPTFTMEKSARLHLGGRAVDLMWMGRAHTDGDIIVYFPDFQIVVTGDLFNTGGGLSRLIDYSSGGSIRDWTQTLDNILQLGFETIVPGHGRPTTRDVMHSYRADTEMFRDHVRELISEGISRDQLESVLREDFGWGNLHVQRGLDGIIGELQ